MPKRRRNSCKVCGASADDVPISRAGRCPKCARDALNAANQQLALRSGPVWDKYADRLLTAIERNGRPTTPYPPDA